MRLELQEAIRGRRSVRMYLPRPIPEKDVEIVLESALWAPYAFQRWLFIIVKDEGAKRDMMAWFIDQGRNLHVLEAPVAIVVCIDLSEEGWARLAERDHGKADFKEFFSIQESAAAIQNMLLTAYERGLAACWNGSFDEEAVRKVLGIPETIRPVAIISLGYSAESPPQPERRPLAEVVRCERYR